MTLGQTIRKARKDNMSQVDLAARIGVSRQTIIKIENDQTDPAFSKVQKIAKILGIKLDSI